MTTQTETVESILRPLAERTVSCPRHFYMPPGCPPRTQCWDCSGGTDEPKNIPDPRFDVLRLGHQHYGQGGYEDILSCDEAACEGAEELDTSLGAIVRAAAACGLDVIRMDGVAVTLRNPAGEVFHGYSDYMHYELASARALVAAVDKE